VQRKKRKEKKRQELSFVAAGQWGGPGKDNDQG